MAKIKKTDPELQLFKDVAGLIEESRNYVAVAINSALTLLYWKIGKCIDNNMLQNKRGEYGKQVIISLSRKLTETYGRGWSEKNLRHCLYTVETFPDLEIISTLSRQLSWSHIKEIIYLKDELQKEFYIEICRIEKWSVRMLRDKIDGMLYERTAISKKPDVLIKQELKALRNDNVLTPDLKNIYYSKNCIEQ
jgi:hypothetical protein